MIFWRENANVLPGMDKRLQRWQLYAIRWYPKELWLSGTLGKAIQMQKLRFLILAGLLVILGHSALAQGPGQPQGPGRPVAPVQTAPTIAFRATNYDVRASLDVVGQVLTGVAKVDFTASEASRTVEVDLNQNLRVSAVRDVTGKPLGYERDDSNPLKLRVMLSDLAPAGGKVTVEFDYSGPLSGALSGPDAGARLAYLGKDGSYLLLPARWFPLTDFPANRYTGVFQIEVPGNLVVVGTGTAGSPETVTPRRAAAAASALGNARPTVPVSPSAAPPPPLVENERILYTFRVEKPEAAGTFVAAPLQLSPVRAEGVSFSVYTPPAAANTAQSYADTVAHILDVYSGQFGPLPSPEMKIAQLPDNTVAGYAAPGLLLVSARQWT